MSQGKKIVLTERQEAWLVKHFKHTKNADVAAKLGISPQAVARFAARLGLKKTPQFMKKCQREMTDAAHRSHLRNGTYPPKGYIIPRVQLTDVELRIRAELDGKVQTPPDPTLF